MNNSLNCAINFHLYRIIANTTEAVHSPAKRANGAAPLLVPYVDSLAACSKRRFTLVVVNACEYSLTQTQGSTVTEQTRQVPIFFKNTNTFIVVSACGSFTTVFVPLYINISFKSSPKRTEHLHSCIFCCCNYRNNKLQEQLKMRMKAYLSEYSV